MGCCRRQSAAHARPARSVPQRRTRGSSGPTKAPPLPPHRFIIHSTEKFPSHSFGVLCRFAAETATRKQHSNLMRGTAVMSGIKLSRTRCRICDGLIRVCYLLLAVRSRSHSILSLERLCVLMRQHTNLCRLVLNDTYSHLR